MKTEPAAEARCHMLDSLARADAYTLGPNRCFVRTSNTTSTFLALADFLRDQHSTTNNNTASMSNQNDPAAGSDGTHGITNKPKTTVMMDLRAELLVRVANNLKKKDILNFRKLCRELAAAAEDQFISEYFTERHHLLEVHSLEVLKNITADYRFIRRLRKLVLVQVALGDQLLCLRCYQQDPALSNLALCKTSCPNVTSIWSEKFEHQRTIFKSEEKGASLLKECLTNIKKAAITPEFGLHESGAVSLFDTFARPVRGVYGQASLDKKLGIHGNRTARSWRLKHLVSFNESLELILEALCSTGLSIKSLSLFKSRPEDSAPLSLGSELLANLFGPLKNLESIQISGGHLLRRKNQEALSKLFSRAPALSRLSLWLDTTGGHQEINWAARTFTSNSLKQLEIVSGNVDSFRDPRQLLMKHQKSLTHLTFRNTHFDEAGKYFQFFAEQLNLSHFRFSQLAFLGSSAMKKFKSENCISGPEAVKKWLWDTAEYFKQHERA